MKKENILIIVTAIILISLVATGIYFWQQSVLKTAKNEFAWQISEIQALLEKAESAKEELQQQNNTLQQENNALNEEKEGLKQTISDLTRTPEHYIKVISPNGGENLCLDENFNIQWEHKGVSSVRILAYLPGEGFAYLGTFPADFNETGEKGKGIYNWKVGSMFYGGTIKEGSLYEIIIEEVASEGALVKDKSDNVFSILSCKG